MHAHTMLLALLACNGPDGPLDSDTADSAVDSVVDWSWPALVQQPTWESEEDGFATGAGFADFDGDGDPDLLVAYGNDIQRGPLGLYSSDGGSLPISASWLSETRHYYGHLAIGDVDNDGDPDAVVSRFLGDEGWEEAGGVEVWLNDNGLLTPGWTAEGFHSFSCALGDIDLDGDLDLVAAAGEPYHNEPQGNRVWFNNGDGTFTLAWTDEAAWTMDVALFDADGDGWLDVASANMDSPHTIQRFNGQGFEEYWSAEGPAERFEGNTLDFADVNDDGYQDLVVSDNIQLGGIGTVSLYCGPDFGRCWESVDPERYQSAVSLEDVDGDGRVDLVAGAWGRGDFGGDAVRIYRNTDDGLETWPSWTSDSQGVAEAFAWADLDGTGSLLDVEHPGGLYRVPQGAEIAELSPGLVSDGRHVTGEGGTITLVEPVPRDLAVSNWNKTVGNFLFTRAP
jgi:hypothetical protein